MAKTKEEARLKRKRRIRKKISGTPEHPRMSVYRSLNHIYVQVVDDDTGRTVVSASTRDKSFEGEGDKTSRAKSVGALVAQRCKDHGIAKVVFDRNGYMYHGRVKAVAEAAREAGLEF